MTGLQKTGPWPRSGRRDAEYPVWVSFAEKTTMLKDPDTVILELEVDPALLTFISIEKWSAILDYSYIAADEADRNRHRELLKGLWGQQ